MKLKTLFFVSLLSCIMFACMGNKVKEPKPCGPLPAERQIKLQDMEMYAFIHYSLNTYTDQEWGYGNESPQLFNPSDLDCRQWARVCKQAGMKGIILTAKHHCGFCLWPSAYTDYSVKSSPWKDGKGDVVRELADACREEGLKFAVYLSPWDRNHPQYGYPEYIDYFRNQLRELLSQYGDMFEVWFDGANGGDGWYGGANERRHIDRKTYYQWPETYKLIRGLQPEIVIWADVGTRADLRWVGTEAGYVGSTNWSLMMSTGDVPFEHLHFGVETGDIWVPGETNTSIRPGWFYHQKEDNHVKSVAKLMDTFYKSVGRNSTLLLNFPVAPNGRIHPTDSVRGLMFARMVESVFKDDLAKHAKATASNERGNSRRYAANKVLDGKADTYWATDDDVTSATLTLDFGEPTSFNRFVAEEYIRLGQRVKKFALDALVDGQWVPLKDQLVEHGDGLTTIGHRRIICFPTVTATQLRMTIVDSKACPLISKIGVYLAPELKEEDYRTSLKHSSNLNIAFPSPKTMLIEVDQQKAISAFRYLPPQGTDKDGVVTHYSLWGMLPDGKWEKLGAGEFSNIVNNPIWQEVLFSPVNVSLLRFEAEHLESGERLAYDDVEVVHSKE